MGSLNRLFGSTESIAKETELDDESILERWKDYHQTIPKKKVIIEKLSVDVKLKADLQELELLLILGLTDIHKEEKEESELISDLEAIEHSKKVKRVHRLEQCLGYAETKYEYVYHLLHQLHSILKSQMHIVRRLIAGSKNAEKLISHLKQQLELELEIIKKIEQIETFHNLFLALIKGEHIIRSMDSRGKRLLKKMQKGFTKTFASMAGRSIGHQITPNEKDKGLINKWAIDVFNRIEVRVSLGIMEDVFPGLHPDIDFEFVNRPEFIILVRKSIYDLKEKKVSEQMINVFVHLFREWYNHRINVKIPSSF